MKKKFMKQIFIATTILSLSLGACTPKPAPAKTESTQSIETSSTETSSTETTESIKSSSNVNLKDDVSLKDSGISDEDYTSSTDNAISIKLSDNNSTSSDDGVSISNNIINITKAGTYILNGSLTDGGIQISVGEDENVRLILNGVSINNNTLSAITMNSGNKLIITLADGSTNTLSDGTTYSDEDIDATIYSSSNLTINGNGTLNLSANYQNGLKAKDNLIIVSGNISIKSADNAIKGNDLVVIANGSINIDATGKGITSNGSVYIYDGKLDIANSEEGLEGLTVELYGANININSTDDGINTRVKADDSLSESEKEAFSARYQETAYLKLDGATVVVNAEGDGIDSNGDVFIESGYILVNGPSSAGNATLDYNGNAYITGGTYLGLGNGGMRQGFSSESSVASVNVDFDSSIAANTEITLSDNSGNKILSFTNAKSISNILFAISDINIGDTVSISAGSQSKEITVSADSGVSSSGFGKRDGGPRDGDNGNKDPKNFNDGNRPPRNGKDGKMPPAPHLDDKSNQSPRESTSTTSN